MKERQATYSSEKRMGKGYINFWLAMVLKFSLRLSAKKKSSLRKSLTLLLLRQKAWKQLPPSADLRGCFDDEPRTSIWCLGSLLFNEVDPSITGFFINCFYFSAISAVGETTPVYILLTLQGWIYVLKSVEDRSKKGMENQFIVILLLFCRGSSLMTSSLKIWKDFIFKD